MLRYSELYASRYVHRHFLLSFPLSFPLFPTFSPTFRCFNINLTIEAFDNCYCRLRTCLFLNNLARLVHL